MREFVLEPGAVGVREHTTEELRGGDAQHNAAVAREVLHGADLPATEAAVLNAGLALAVAADVEVADEQGFLDLVADQVRVARSTLTSGAAVQTLEGWVAASGARRG